jgi:hypothetical protein
MEQRIDVEDSQYKLISSTATDKFKHNSIYILIFWYTTSLEDD